MTQYGVDCFAPPTRAQATTMVKRGFSFLLVYIGGPRSHAGRWPNAKIGAIADIFKKFLPTYYGWQKGDKFSADIGTECGDEANINAGAAGFGPDAPIMLDIEAGVYVEGDPNSDTEGIRAYAQAWSQRVRDAGHQSGLYSNDKTCEALRDLFDFVWMADWGHPIKVTPTSYLRGKTKLSGFNPETPPPSEGWQFANGVWAAVGMEVDFNSATDYFAFGQYSPPPG